LPGNRLSLLNHCF